MAWRRSDAARVVVRSGWALWLLGGSMLIKRAQIQPNFAIKSVGRGSFVEFSMNLAL